MSEIKVKDGRAYCEMCGKDVHVREKPGVVSTPQRPYVLVDASGHTIAERATKDEPWQKPT